MLFIAKIIFSLCLLHVVDGFFKFSNAINETKILLKKYMYGWVIYTIRILTLNFSVYFRISYTAGSRYKEPLQGDSKYRGVRNKLRLFPSNLRDLVVVSYIYVLGRTCCQALTLKSHAFVTSRSYVFHFIFLGEFDLKCILFNFNTFSAICPRWYICIRYTGSTKQLIKISMALYVLSTHGVSQFPVNS